VRDFAIHRLTSSTKTGFWDREQAIDICTWNFLPQELLHLENGLSTPQQDFFVQDAIRVSVNAAAFLKALAVAVT